MFKYLCYLLVFCLFGSAFGGTTDPQTPDSKYIEYGKKFTYIGQLGGKTEDDKIFFASAVAIGPKHIITAAHVVQKAKNCYILINSKKFPINNVISHKDFNEDNFGYYDIAIGKSDEEFGLDFYPMLYDQDNEVGKLCCISGYGVSGSFITGAVVSDSKRRAGSNIIDSVDRELLICSPSKSNSPSKTSLEFLIANGDSGGGLFIDGKLAGINSCVIGKPSTGTKSDYNCESGHTRISKNLEWIRDNLK